MPFKGWMEGSAKKRRTKLVLALDLTGPTRLGLLDRSLEILKVVKPYVCAVKVNKQLLLSLGLYSGVKKLVTVAHKLGLPCIMDAKINDVGHMNEAEVKHYFRVGFDAVTANPFVGWEEGLEPVFSIARGLGRGVILLIHMSHRGSIEGYGLEVKDPITGRPMPHFRIFAEKALEWMADGAVVGATYPEKIATVHKILGGKVPIYSPGITLHGGELEGAIRAGASYLIVGRAICDSRNPVEAALNLKERAAKFKVF